MGIEKVLLGIILVIVGLWLLIYGYNGTGWLSDFVSVVKGILPVFLVFIGAILVWIESEELKVEKPRRKR